VPAWISWRKAAGSFAIRVFTLNMKRFPNSGTTGTTTGPIQTMGEGRVRLWERTIPVGFAAWEEVVPRSESTEFSKMERTGRDLE
jgi:hypothetical protein